MSIVIFSMIGGTDIPPLAMLGVPIVSILTGLTGFVFLSKKPLTKRQIIFRYLWQHILVQTIVLGIGTIFLWVNWTYWLSVLLISLSIVAVYGMVILVEYVTSRHVANQMNEKLERHFSDEN